MPLSHDMLSLILGCNSQASRHVVGNYLKTDLGAVNQHKLQVAMVYNKTKAMRTRNKQNSKEPQLHEDTSTIS